MSKRTGRAILVESSKLVRPWRTAIVYAFLESKQKLIRGPVGCSITFTLSRPKSAKKGAVPSKAPDIDKLMRSSYDGLSQAGAWEDDSRVVFSMARKCYPNEGPDALPVTGAKITIWSIEEALL